MKQGRAERLQLMVAVPVGIGTFQNDNSFSGLAAGPGSETVVTGGWPTA